MTYTRKTALGIIILCAALTLAASAPMVAVSQDKGELITGKIFNDTDIAPTDFGPVELNIVIDEIYMGRLMPGEKMLVALEQRRVPYEVRAYAFDFDGSVFFAVVPLPLWDEVDIPVYHRGEHADWWVAFEGIR
ncbi:MAG: hypothetical protein JW885_16230 [Deltaproteobacteria bacterium]|nr:hypothetical protein [Candidatus Zymogenaceae bacterium]